MKKIIYVVISVLIIMLAIKALIQSNGESVEFLKNNLVMVDDGKYHESNDGKIVAVKGVLSTDTDVKDERFGVSAQNSARLVRKVLEYRYFEKGTESTTVGEDGKKEQLRMDRWKGRWEDKGTVGDYIDNDAYQVSEIVKDVTKDDSIIDVNKEEFTTNPKLNGIFEIPEEKLKKFRTNTPVIIKVDDENPNQVYYIDNYDKKFTIKNNEFTTVQGSSEEIGDIRVSFSSLDLNKLGTVTVVAKQEEGKLVEYTADNMDVIYEVYKGSLSFEEIIEQMESDNNSAKLGVAITIVVIIIIGLVVFRDNIADFMEKKNIHFEVNGNFIQILVFIGFLTFFLFFGYVTIKVFNTTIRAKEAIPVTATVVEYERLYHGEQIAYDYKYEYVVNDQLYEKEYNNVNKIPFDPDSPTEDGNIAEFEAYYDKDDPSISYIPFERSHSILGYGAGGLLIVLSIVGMVKVIMNIADNMKSEKRKKE